MSSFHDQVQSAIGAHGLWKARLRKAIDSGSSEMAVADVRPDNHCEFGKWLYSEGRTSFGTREAWESVRKLHADFHSEAARVLGLAVGGHRAEAEKAMEFGGAFTHISSALVSELKKAEKNAA